VGKTPPVGRDGAVAKGGHGDAAPGQLEVVLQELLCHVPVPGQPFIATGPDQPVGKLKAPNPGGIEDGALSFHGVPPGDMVVGTDGARNTGRGRMRVRRQGDRLQRRNHRSECGGSGEFF